MFGPWKLESLIPAALRSDPVPPPPLVPYTLAHLIAWLETKKSQERYNWGSCETCLFAQYGDAISGAPHRDYHTARHNLHRVNGATAGDQIISEIAVAEPWTMGGALERARALEDAL